ncbi:hypothetical protein FH972_024660 [Carpinus fangiana]|uniref:Glutamine amidotransferase type-2 domain-containing protein n=1 Tax=Carpinus fangiana TaxID=176857 RepID=A0A5N6KYM3_9ROSI|nr:hypothetical protein FH972_024660 [Carpinus fangiana]
MCRWFAYISPTEPCLLSDVLITPNNSLSHQVSEHYLPGLLPHGQEHELDDSKDKLLRARNSLLNMDGMGICFYTSASSNFTKDCFGSRPALYKSTSPLMNDFNFKNLCNNTETKCCFAHIRASSGASIGQVNNHPFTFGRHAFMHNGVVASFTAIKRELSQLLTLEEYAHIQGSTDSEHMAALYIHHLTEARGAASWEEEFKIGEMADALATTIADVLRVQHKVLGSEPDSPPVNPSSINLAVTDGTKFVAVRFRNHETEQPPSLYWSDTAGVTLNSKFPDRPDDASTNFNALKKKEEHGKHIIVASEPTTYKEKEWHLIKQNEMILVDSDGSVSFEPCSFDWTVR